MGRAKKRTKRKAAKQAVEPRVEEAPAEVSAGANEGKQVPLEKAKEKVAKAPAIISTESGLLTPPPAVEVLPPAPKEQAPLSHLYTGSDIGKLERRALNTKCRTRPTKASVTFGPNKCYEIAFDHEGIAQIPVCIADHLSKNGGPIILLP